MIDWTSFVTLVGRHKHFLLTTHIRPDGDGLGSMLALAEVMHSLRKKVRLVIGSTWPPRYDFLDPDKRIERFNAPGDAWRGTDVAIVLDTGTWNQLGDFGPFLKSLNVPKAVIDHHPTQDDLGAERFIDTTAEATGRLVYEATVALGVSLPKQAASMLFVALAMDTGWFGHSNTTKATWELAAKLVEAGADSAKLKQQLFEQNTLARLRLRGLVDERAQLAESGKVAYSEIRKNDYAVTGAVPQDSEDLVNDVLSIAGVEVGLFFMEQPAGGIKVSFRSRSGVDIRRVAEQFGGGGHRQAAGAIVQGSLEEARSRVLSAVHDAMKAQTLGN